MYIWRLLCVLSLVLALAACTPAAAPATGDASGSEATTGETAAGDEPATDAGDEPITLLVWDQFTNEAASAAFDQINQTFMAEHPNIEIVRETYPNEQMRQIAKTALGSGTGPDIIYHDTGPGQGGVLARAGLLIPLDDFSDYTWKEDFYSMANQESTFDGQLYGLGNELEFVGIFYNQTLIDQEGLVLPQTWDELLTFCAEASEKGYVPMSFSMNPGWQSYHFWSAIAYNVLGEEKMNDLLFENQGSWESPELVDAIRLWFVDLKEAGCFVDDVNSLTADDANAMFFAGESLLHPTGTWLVGQIVENMSETYEVGIMPVPSVGGGDRFYPVGIGSAFFISSETEHPEEAAMLIDYYFSPESARIWVEQANFVPPVPFDASGLNISPLLQTVIDTLQGGGDTGAKQGFYINHVAPEAYNQMMRDGFQAVLAGLKTPEEQAADLQQLWEEGFQ